MSRLKPDKLHVSWMPHTRSNGPVPGRCYTLTHSDATGDLYLTIGPEYDRAQISGWYTRLMRDEVLAEWRQGEAQPELHVHCHISGGVVFGTAEMRLAIFRRELPLVLEAIVYGDSHLFDAQPGLENAPVFVHFHATQSAYNCVQSWGVCGDYRLKTASADQFVPIWA